ncbi:hypothetical protein [Stieleria sp.]|uniref:Uncharacterized protein n=1 Tax=Stieleria magnilauensis TaxID=2527963 RepID=A0ABX5XY33_9BACT|nr:hypothetical protein TBK1r_59650 [Planctomycetes bacterium TBK1r]QDV87016.1 hypothetical protein TBK1r_60430 [Planctomycetes bacterium TBK1r]
MNEDDQQQPVGPWWVKLVQPLGFGGLAFALLYVVLNDAQVERAAMRAEYSAAIERHVSLIERLVPERSTSEK